ncbi:hypothetical protein FSP39_001534 [Pinctada imbricata]|uniref:glutamine synthetase n=1 Tax=Pinctada imbricata TaxID=66713 RepID=A0AA88Y2H9_PINIB|nr:hypothetical protein FSP39_001534 [Pinctada imbricata]
MSRYLLIRVAEMMGVNVLMKPKPSKAYGSGGHLNFSTNQMRGPGGIQHINKAIEMLSKSDQGPLLKMYDPTFGVDNAERMKESHWSPSMNFESAVGNKQTCTIRIPSMVNVNGRGYLEDRRPPANIEPYAASEALVRACILGEFMRK